MPREQGEIHALDAVVQLLDLLHPPLDHDAPRLVHIGVIAVDLEGDDGVG